MVSASVAVCDVEPDVPVTVTVAVVAAVLEPLAQPETIPRPSSARASVSTSLPVRRLRKPRQHSASARLISGTSGLWRAAEAVCVEVMVNAVAEGPGVGVTIAGLKEQVAPEGRPLQAKDTGEAKPLTGETT